MNRSISRKPYWAVVSIVLVVLLLTVGQQVKASSNGKQIFNITEIPKDEKLLVTESRIFDAKTQENYSFITIKTKSTELYKLKFTIDPSSGQYIPLNLPDEEEYVHSWGMSAGVIALKVTLEDMLNLSSDNGDYSEYISEFVLEDASAIKYPGKDIYLALGAGNFSELAIPDSSSFDAVTLVIVIDIPGTSGGTVAMFFWKAGRLAGVRGTTYYTTYRSYGPFWRFFKICCHFFYAICPGCDFSHYLDCLDGGSNPCHAFDSCCIWPYFFTWLVHTVF